MFKDRSDAGRQLAQKLEKYRGAVVYALPRGGAVVGFEIARHLNLPLDLIIVRKIGHPFNPEFAICATDEEGHLLCSETALVDSNWLERAAEKEQQEARRRRELYLSGRSPVNPAGKIAILVDDGVATGLTFRLALQNLKSKHPDRIVAALPVLPPEIAETIAEEADELVALEIPRTFLGAVGAYYQNFDQVSDAEVVELLKTSRSKP